MATPAEARQLVEDHRVRVGGVPAPKITTLVDRDTPIELSSGGARHVGRGAVKLAGALQAFPVEVAGRRVLDAGSSTGGFTEVLLERGASQVVALDVGYGQLDDRLRRDSRVRSMERMNLRHVGPDDVGGRFPLIVADLSFISLCTVADALAGLCQPGADLVLLIKPQFEAPKRDVGRGGVVARPEVRREAVTRVLECLAERGLAPRALSASVIDGADGNREVFVWCRQGAQPALDLEVPA